MAGADLPRRRFRPHVTLTRANKAPAGPARDRLAEALGERPEIPAFVAAESCCTNRRIGRGSARHDPIARYPLCR
jgi:2'-5' RNA ligase